MPHSPLTINGKVVSWPSVSEVIGLLDKPFLARWRGKIGNEAADKIAKESAAVGTEVHQLIEEVLKYGTASSCGSSERVQKCFKAWFDWWNSQTYIPNAMEVKVISKKKKFHGTFDALLESNDISIVVDWKISKSDDHFRYLQLAGYAYAYYEMTKVKINEGLIVRINPDTLKVKETSVANLWNYVPLFLALRKLFEFVRTGKIKGGHYDIPRRAKKAA